MQLETVQIPRCRRLPGLEMKAFPNFQPVRLLNNGRRNRIVGSFFSLKSGRPQPWESHNERRGLEFAEVDPAVRRFCAQPFVMNWRESGKPRSYTPDRLEWRADGSSRVVEVKHQREDIEDPELNARLEAIAIGVRAWGAEFAIEFGQDLKEHPSHSFVQSVLYFRRTEIAHADWMILDELAGRNGCFHYGGFEAAYSTPEIAFAKFASLLVRGELSLCRLEKPAEDTPIKRSGLEAAHG